jgi:hypothetical protein
MQQELALKQPKFLSVAAVKELSELKDKTVANKNYVL